MGMVWIEIFSMDVVGGGYRFDVSINGGRSVITISNFMELLCSADDITVFATPEILYRLSGMASSRDGGLPYHFALRLFRKCKV